MKGVRIAILVAVPVAAAAVLLVVDPLPQDPAYHRFVDTRRLLGVDNFLNVISNLPFLLIGAAGLLFLRASRHSMHRVLLACYTAFFAGVLLTGAGSAWYHLDPGTATLVWDRLPMTLAFMGLTAAVLGEFVSPRAARHALAPLLAAGVLSVAWWAISEARDAGDLRPYALVQFLPLLLIPLVVLMYTGDRVLKRAFWGMLGLYLLAKAAELLDAPIFELGRVLSGHTIKHLCAAAATWLLLRALERRGRPPGGREDEQ